MNWDTLTKNKTYITDLGSHAGNKTVRYAVWIPINEDSKVSDNIDRSIIHHNGNPISHKIADMGNDLDILMKKYNVETQYVFSVI